MLALSSVQIFFHMVLLERSGYIVWHKFEMINKNCQLAGISIDGDYGQKLLQ
jgi:hypothetical protein